MHWQPPSPFLSVNNSVAVKSAISGDRLSEFKVQLLPVWPWASDLISLSSIFLFLAAAAAAKSLQSCPTLCDTTVGSPPQSLGFSRQEHWSGLPSPSPLHEREKWKGSRSVVSDFSRLHGLQPTRLHRPWDFLGKSTGVGCHCLLRKQKLYCDKFNKDFKKSKHTVIIWPGIIVLDIYPGGRKLTST